MGFKPPRKIYTLDFEGTELHGLEVRACAASVGMMLELGSMVEGFDGVPDVEDVEAMPESQQAGLVRNSMSSLRAIVEMYVTVLRSWNYEDEAGAPVPATVEGMLTLDPSHLMMIIKAWQQAVVAVPPASSPTSNDGALSEVLRLPMEPLSESQAS